MGKYRKVAALLLGLALVLAGCAAKEPEIKKQEPKRIEQEESESKKQEDAQKESDGVKQDAPQTEEEPGKKAEIPLEEETDLSSEDELSEPVLNPDTVAYAEEEVVTTARVRVRQAPSTESEVYQTEPLRSKFEYQLTLQVSLKLQAELEARGYQVIMVRTSHDVNISNSERAAIANNAGADAFIRVHANGSEDSGQNGILTICPTSANPYMGNLYSQCRSLSECVLDGAVNATGANKQYIWETDSMSGINWCTVPVTIVEMGFMTNPTEDANMADEGYQQRLSTGIADGLDAYFGI